MSTTVYDDVFRTMVQKMPRLFIALINEVFRTDYPDDVEFEQLRNEHYEENGKIITDSIFKIRQRIFHIEIQSTEDEKIAIRMIEYDFAIGLEAAQNDGAPYKVELPESCVIYLRHNDKTPDYLDVDVTFDFKKLMQLIITIMEHVFDDKSKLGKEAEKIMGGGKVLDLLPEEVIEERDQLRIDNLELKKHNVRLEEERIKAEKDKQKAEKDKEKALSDREKMKKENEMYRKLFGPLPKI